ncbi:MAG: bifunctional precorrin-2 dehydrogenase/sirohydrochlorin ferrochelatase [Chloroflexia bacterium]|nr:bifunctional precorrin-2 dehydrogenase/sirohydrochlorin ferrochelatase [Chloroflexia bacterium]MDQ3411830.1 bifunctional precorrin-2 dehydrogenase/sirohydrochlorin ferrochelatase [Chloroflexota bacterium]
MAYNTYPIALDLAGKRCLLVGGGQIAESKLDALLVAGADIRVVSPEVRPRFLRLAMAAAICLHRRPYRADDLTGAALVIAATDDHAVNAGIVTEARAAGILAQAVDNIPYCDFHAVAIVRRGELQVSISTNGRSPAFARWLREELDASLPVEYGDLLAVLGEVRDELKADGPIPEYEHWRDAITDEVFTDLRQGDHASARRRLHDRLIRAAPEPAPVAGAPR